MGEDEDSQTLHTDWLSTPVLKEMQEISDPVKIFKHVEKTEIHMNSDQGK